MISLEEAIGIFKSNNTTKNINAIIDYDNKFVFLTKPKGLKKDDENYDISCEFIDKNNGEYYVGDIFDLPPNDFEEKGINVDLTPYKKLIEEINNTSSNL